MSFLFSDFARPDDLGDGLTWATAKKTINACIALAAQGDSIFVKGGQVYQEAVNTALGVDGTLADQIHLYLNATGVNAPDGTPFITSDRSLQAEISPSVILSAAFQWTATGTNNEFYLELSGGGDPSLQTVGHLRVGDLVWREVGTIGSLNDQFWDWGDGGGGFNTVVARSDAGAPLLTDCRITTNDLHCMQTSRSHWQIYGGDCHDGSNYGILVDEGSVGVDCYYMDLHHNNFHGHTSYTHGTKMYYCRSYRNGIKGFQGHTPAGLIDPDKINYFYNCTSFENNSYGFAAYNVLYCRGCLSMNNGLYSFYKQVSDPTGLINMDEQGNCWYSESAGNKDWGRVNAQTVLPEIHPSSIEENPQMVDIGSKDVSLKLTSPCRLKGSIKYNAVDFEGKPVGNLPDMGCLEHKSTASGSPNWS